MKAAADTLRTNPKLDAGRAIGELAVGEALLSLLDASGSPAVTERAWVLPPMSQIGPASEAERDAIRKAAGPMYKHYEQTIDRESAYEKLKARALSNEPPPAASSGAGSTLSTILFGSTGPRGGRRDGLVDAAAKSTARAIGSSLGRAIMRGALGSLLGGGRRR